MRMRRPRLKCDGTRTEIRFRLSAKRTRSFKLAGASVQSTTGSRGVRISGSNAGYTMFRGSEGYWLPTPFAIFPFPTPPVRHRVPSHFNWSLHRVPTQNTATNNPAASSDIHIHLSYIFVRFFQNFLNSSKIFKALQDSQGAHVSAG